MSHERHLRDTASSPEDSILDKMDLLRSTFRALNLHGPEAEDDFSIQQLGNERTTPVLENENGNFETRKDFKDQMRKQSRKQSREEDEKLETISLADVAWHDTSDDCWIAIYDYVYNCTDFVKNHPGGQDILLEYAGRDATLAFIGTGHSKEAKQILQRYLIGELPPEERIFRIPGGVKIVDY
ncbi:cytochrome B5-like protein [Belonocnema kinseyi]|uniref:cytochrome B5-like protein n=1 Tax=Belonocnema kinseyi TaxID=2817044 RepID=UPI00143D2C34|nr:cytochrome B5-like protein [Belonocnema kinseyi]